MTDNEIKKALECCILGDCQGCFYGDTDQRHCKDDLMQNALDLINRLEAENRSLISDVNLYRQEVERLQIEQTIAKFEKNKDFANAKVEGVKEFAEIVKANKHKLFNYIYSSRGFDEQIDNLVKEMAGEHE